MSVFSGVGSGGRELGQFKEGPRLESGKLRKFKVMGLKNTHCQLKEQKGCSQLRHEKSPNEQSPKLKNKA